MISKTTSKGPTDPMLIYLIPNTQHKDLILEYRHLTKALEDLWLNIVSIYMHNINELIISYLSK